MRQIIRQAYALAIPALVLAIFIADCGPLKAQQKAAKSAQESAGGVPKAKIPASESPIDNDPDKTKTSIENANASKPMPLISQQPPAETDADITQDSELKFIRLSYESETPASMDIAVTRMTRGDVVVDLVGAVHIGDGSYYAALNELFTEYEVVLYELVAPEGTKIPFGGARERSDNPLSFLQGGMQSMLGLESQLEKVDYTQTNFVHADMSPEEMFELMESRGQSVLGLAFSAFSEAMSQQHDLDNPANAKMLEALEDVSIFDLFSNPKKIKLVMATQFSETGSLDGALGSQLNQLLIVDRNAVALEGIQQQIDAGKKRIAVFYGAAHMPDFVQRLKSDFQMEVESQRWLEAWQLEEDNATDKQSSSFFGLFK